jgi:TolA-binding protein
MNSSFDQRKLGILVAAILLIGIGIYVTQETSQKKDEAAKTTLYQIETTYGDEEKAVPEADRASGVTLDVDAKFPKTVASINEVLAKKASEQLVYEAGVKLGTLYLIHNQFEKAANTLKGLTGSTGSAFQKASLYYLLGTAEEQMKQFKDAEASFEAGNGANSDGLKGELMLGIVRTSLKLNDKEKAKLYLEKMNKEVAGSHSAQIAASLVKGTES